MEDVVEDRLVSPVVAKRKPKKPYHLQYYNESDSDNEETREQRKARLVRVQCCFSVNDAINEVKSR